MCGRFTLRTPLSEVAEAFQTEMPAGDVLTQLRFNIAPSQEIAAVRQSAQGKRELTWMRWGLVPAWAEDAAIGNRMINARSESIAEKPAFRHAFRRRRCLIPADGFFEWKRDGRAKQPYYIRLKQDGLFAFAGLWEAWQHDAASLESCTIITTAANDLLRPMHERMPVILPREQYATWLDPEIDDAERLLPLLQTYPSDSMTTFPVSTLVNSPSHDNPACIAPVEAMPKQMKLL